MPLLPLSSSSLTYGSGDGGETVHNEDHDAMMESAALYLHLAAHQVQGRPASQHGSRADISRLLTFCVRFCYIPIPHQGKCCIAQAM